MKKPTLDPLGWDIPYIGQRILKTTVAVLLCLLTYLLLGYRGETIPTEAAITAILCMQPYVSRTTRYAVSRIIGTLIGSFWGLLLLVLLHFAPTIGKLLPLPHLLMAIGVMLSLYSAKLLRRSEAAVQAAIVFLCIVISFPDVDSPLRQTGLRLADIFLGTLIAIAVNVFRLPRRKNPNTVFFARAKDLAPDRFAQITPTALFRLNRLSSDGARICLMSEHAPAFFTQQMHAVKLNLPLIVMDGAAIFDLDNNAFLWKNTISKADSTQLRNQLDGMGLSYFIYTVHRDKTCIFHRGKYRDEERLILDRMRRSPYRSYLDEELYEAAEIVYFKVIAEDARMEQIAEALREALPAGRFRIVARPQAGTDGVSGLYIYDSASCTQTAKDVLMKHLQEENAALVPIDVTLKTGYRTEHDALHLLNIIEKQYEPVCLFRRKDK